MFIPLIEVPSTGLGKLLLALVGLAITVFVGRIVLQIAWKLVLVALVLVGLAYTYGVLV